ncbi:helix-turn-helix domain-containing protein [Streptomyces populi]
MATSLKPLADDLPEGRKEVVTALREAFYGSGKTVRQVAREVGMSPAAVSLILSGKRRPKEENLNRIIRATTSREERKADPGYSYVNERWPGLYVMGRVWALMILLVPLGFWIVYTVLTNPIRVPDDCLPPSCGTPPSHRNTPAPSPGPWPQGLPRKSGLLEHPRDHRGEVGVLRLYLSVRGLRIEGYAEEGVAVSVACWVKPDPGPRDDLKYLVRVENGLIYGADRRANGGWFWVDKAGVVGESYGGEGLAVRQCDRQRRTAVRMGMTPQEVAYLAGLSRVD